MPAPGLQQLARRLEYSLLRPDATATEIERLCAQARTHGMCAICVNGSRVELAAHRLEDSEVRVVCMVGFPLGAMDSDAKRFETECAIDGGAHEIDVVVNAGWIKDGLDKLVFRELRDIVEAAEERPVKAAIQTSLLTDDEKVRVCELAARAGARFVATGPGTAGSPVSPLDVAPLRKAAGQTLGIKAQGGIRDAQTALALIDAGATRIGSSAAAALLEGAPKQSGNDASGR